MASTMVALQTVTVGAGGTATVNFTNIPQTYTDLVVALSLKNTTTTSAENGTDMQFSFNGSSANLYSSRIIYNTLALGSAATSGTNMSWVGQSNNNAASMANTFSNVQVYIPNYTSSNAKSLSVESVTEANASTQGMILTAGLWNNTAPISSMSWTSSSGNFSQYSTLTLYGVYNSALETTPAAPTIGTATAGSQAADVAFTPAGSGAPASSYVVTSSPGGLTATGGSSPIQIGGLTSGTAYTFTVRGQNPGGLGAASAASNSVTPYDGYESIATVYGTGGSGTVSFTSIPSGYTHLQIRAFMKNTSNSTNLYTTLNSDTGSNYSWHYLYGTGSAVSAGAGTSSTYMFLGRYPTSTTASAFGPAVIDILDYKDTNKYKTVRSLSGWDTNGSGEIFFASGSWRSTSAVSTITLNTDATNWASGTVFELYGIRG